MRDSRQPGTSGPSNVAWAINALLIAAWLWDWQQRAVEWQQANTTLYTDAEGNLTEQVPSMREARRAVRTTSDRVATWFFGLVGLGFVVFCSWFVLILPGQVDRQKAEDNRRVCAHLAEGVPPEQLRYVIPEWCDGYLVASR